MMTIKPEIVDETVENKAFWDLVDDLKKGFASPLMSE
jgi:hypothetical protein